MPSNRGKEVPLLRFAPIDTAAEDAISNCQTYDPQCSLNSVQWGSEVVIEFARVTTWLCLLCMIAPGAMAQSKKYCDLAVDPTVSAAPPATPPNVAAFVGIWGPNYWEIGKRCGALIVRSVTPDGTADVTYIYGANPTFNSSAAVNTGVGSFNSVGKISGATLKFPSQMGKPVEFQMQSNGRIKGWFGIADPNTLTLARETQ